MIWVSPVSSSSDDLAPRRHHVELLGRVGRVVALEHVDDDDGDVVAAAGRVGRVDERLSGGGRVVGVLEQHRSR